MGRTQVYLGEQELALLAEAARDTGASRSALIRRAVRRTYRFPVNGGKTPGTWRPARAVSPAADSPDEEYVDVIRGGLNERLRTLGVE